MFKNGAITGGFVQMFGEASQYYKDSVGRKANPLPGENREGKSLYNPDPDTGRQFPEDQAMGVIGLNREMDGSWADFFTQGGPLSKALNTIPTLNATAGLHDYWFNNGNPNQIKNFKLWNVPTMLPAAAISVSASIGNAMQGWETNPLSFYLLTQPYDKEKN